LPLKFSINNILYGQIRAYHPDLFYMKYQLMFAVNNDIMEEKVNYLDDPNIINYFYYVKNNSKVIIDEKEILKNDFAQTYLKIIDQNGVKYIFTVSGDHSGSADYRDLIVRLYMLENEKYKLIFDKKETYSIDPGFDSSFLTERFKLLLYRKMNLDDRYK